MDSLICPHGFQENNCEVCYLVKTQYGEMPTIYKPMKKEVDEVEDQLSNTSRGNIN